ncbi:MAG: site-2 protease family protein, partial [Candidatus Hadarchaeia archaeon]
MDVLFRLQILLAVVPILWISIYVIDRKYDLESKGLSLGIGTILWKTKRGLGLIDRLSKKLKNFWAAYGNLSAALGAILMMIFFIFVFWGVVSGLMNYFSPTGGIEYPTSIKTRPILLPGINTPLFLGLVSFAVILIIHEGAHGVILRRLGMKTKSAGLAVFLFIIPGAFVEQDDEEFDNSAPLDRMKVAGAGPVTNVIGAFLILGLIFLLVSPLSGIRIHSVESGEAAENVGLEAGDRLISINGVEMENISHFQDFMQETNPHDTLTVETQRGTHNVVLSEHPTDNIGFLGVSTVEARSNLELMKSMFMEPIAILAIALNVIIGGPSLFAEVAYQSLIPWSVIELMKWIFALNILVGLFNLLPLKPLDGGHMIQ